MGSGSAKKTPSKAGRSPANTRRTREVLKATDSPSPSKRSTRSASGTPTKYSSRLPTDEQRKGNGRVSGRNLIIWSRPRMTEKLLLHLVYECQRHRVALPWNAIAHRFHPGSSGTAVNQHIQRLRKDLIAEGHLVPPPTMKPNSGETIDPEVRGYVRADLESNDRETVRPVLFSESMDDRKFNLPDAFDMEDDETAFVGGDFDDEEQVEGCDESNGSPQPRRGVRGAPRSSPYARAPGNFYGMDTAYPPFHNNGITSFDERMLQANMDIYAAGLRRMVGLNNSGLGEHGTMHPLARQQQAAGPYYGAGSDGNGEAEFGPPALSPYNQFDGPLSMGFSSEQNNGQAAGSHSSDTGMEAHNGLQGEEPFMSELAGEAPIEPALKVEPAGPPASPSNSDIVGADDGNDAEENSGPHPAPVSN